MERVSSRKSFVYKGYRLEEVSYGFFFIWRKPRLDKFLQEGFHLRSF